MIAHAHFGREEVLVAVASGQVVHIYPAQRHQSLPRLVPLARATDGLDVASAAPVPGDIPLGTPCARHHLLRRGQLSPLTRGR